MITEQVEQNSGTLVSPQRLALFGVLLSVALNATGQILFKTARVNHPDASMIEIFMQIETIAGFVIYGLSFLCWLWVLSRAQLSFAYPILSLTFPIVVGLSALLFGEIITPMRWAGVMFIVIGVSLITRT
jgi:drug/metabolite transporter (DMT)-like permease